MTSFLADHPLMLMWISLLGILLTFALGEYLRPYVLGGQNDPLQRTSLRLYQITAVLLGVCLAGGLLALNAVLTRRLHAPTPAAADTAASQGGTIEQTPPLGAPDSSATPAPQVVVVATSTPAQPSATPRPQARIVNTNDLGVNVRVKPSTSAQIVEVAAEGALVELLGETEQDEFFSWMHVRLGDGREGWVVARFLEPLP
ncbi:MAG: hypothetical protein Fur0018_06740 [Anaerolineales bacterium]